MKTDGFVKALTIFCINVSFFIFSIATFYYIFKGADWIYQINHDILKWKITVISLIMFAGINFIVTIHWLNKWLKSK